MENPVTVEIKLTELQEVKGYIQNALSPQVTFSDDIDKMRKVRDEKREQALYQLLGWINGKPVK